MGWLTGYGSPTEIKNEVLKCFCPNVNPTANYDLIDYKSTNYGRNLWVAIKSKTDAISMILLILIKKEGDWGYKDMDESACPCAVDCPLELIEKTTGDGSQYSKEWREKVKAYHAKRKQISTKIKEGDIVLIYGKKYQLTEKVKRSWRGYSLENGKTYRIKPSQIELLDQTADFVLNKI